MLLRMSLPDSNRGAPKRQLTLLDSTCIIVGIIIGSGIYMMTPIVANNVGGTWSLIAVCIAGGLISLVGAMCYAELATTYPREGGDYVYLTRAFGRRAGFLFAWAEYWIIRPGNIGMLAYVFALYANKLYPLQFGSLPAHFALIIYAATAIILLSAVNILGVRSGKWTQNILTIVKVVGLLGIFFVGFFLVPSSDSVPTKEPTSNYSTAVILMLFIYGGWSEMSYVAAEVRRPEKNIFRALVLGTITVTILYVLVFLAMTRVLGFEGVQGSGAIADDLFRKPFGTLGGRAMSLLVCLSCLGAINGMIFTGSRISYALGTEHRLYSWLGRWNKRLDAPVRALCVQTVVAIALVVGFGWKDAGSGFGRLFNFTTPVFWFFVFMVAIALFVLRYKEPDIPRPHRVVFYPWLPILFCLVCAMLFKSSFDYALSNKSYEAAWAIGILLVGGAMSFYDPPIDRPNDKGSVGKL